ncbi:MAG: AarF/ABC1/UbiB kinase family protein [Candidatus Cloacimonetes bacterium]|nr:AarF/ABC1/UbiB kinase family protein [Candidatus Cloacimonadota bacterium]
MNIRQIHKSYVNILRVQDIAQVLVKYGFSDILDSLKVGGALGLASKVGLISKNLAALTRPQRLKLCLEELGPTFVKLGQILSTRDDILDPEYLVELRDLQENVSPLTKETVEVILLDFYDVKSLDEVFLEFEWKPIASASISQAHRAKLKNNTEVVVKVQRPNIKTIIEQDVRVLTYFVELFEDQFGDPNGATNWARFFEEFISGILKELDFAREARLMSQFDSMFEAMNKLAVPKVYYEFSGKTVLIQEFIYGHKITEVSKLSIDRQELCENLIKSYIFQIFSEGLFHGDPHPGNLRILDDGTIVFLDFGMCGLIDEETMSLMARLFWGAGRKDFELIARSITKICTGSVLGTDKILILEIKDIVQAYQNLPLGAYTISEFMDSIETALKGNQLKLPSNLSLLLKALVTLEQIIKELDSGINLMDYLLPEIKTLVKERLGPSNIKGFVEAKSMVLYDYLAEIPEDLFQILKNIQRNQHEATVIHKNVGSYFSTLEKILHRLILGILISSMLVGSSILLAFDRSGNTLTYFLGFAGYIVAGIFALALIYFIVTSKDES